MNSISRRFFRSATSLTAVVLALIAAGCRETPPAPAAAPKAEAPALPLLVQKLHHDEAGNAAAGGGILSVRNNCLVMEHRNGEHTLLLWPAEARLERSPDGRLRIIGTAGLAQHTVRVGEEILVGGSELGSGEKDVSLIGPGRPIAANMAFPKECSGRVWNIYSFEPGALPGSPAAVRAAK